MPAFPVLVALALVPTGAGSAEPQSADPEAVTIYHCTDARGQPVIRDSPCAAGQTERRVTTLQRPVDPPSPPPAPPAPAEPAPPPAAAAATRTVIARAPAPMYECTTPEGDTYTSDDGQGNPRWVPLWTLGYGVHSRHPQPPRREAPPRMRPPIGAPVRPAAAGAPTGSGFHFDGVGRPSPELPRNQPRPPQAPPAEQGGHWHHHGGVPYAAGGTWVQDSCRLLPQHEACELLRERSWTLRQRFNHALQGEQREITAERKRIALRMESDC
ncbi:hypothetical protein LY625_05630 [Lysobacter sp. GX 14042]|uniref:DUF4124 domain-containing protein n=1 Tax=Lysobacter sp. GX 14042 TaxID=2907155 RepID=UPI001F1CDB7F|nr:DUF4124 domain-containing protein [Lysobacter sp. GX 14042]MCE7032102.1 hypothetical protein [Lysobacter sp. GX 14042]